MAQTNYSTSGINFSPRAIRPDRLNFEPPLPGTAAFSRVRGRAGDLIVLQLSSANGEKQPRRDALRTLGLKGPRSACLRMSREPSVWGNIRAVRDLIAVIELPNVNYGIGQIPEREDSNAELVESFKYGSDTKPAQLWRAESGEYFGFEGDRQLLLSYWSTRRPLDVLLKEIESAGLAIDERASSGWVAPMGADPKNGTWRTIEPFVAAARQILIPLTEGAELTWQAPYERFHDLDFESAEVGLLTRPPDASATRNLFRLTGAPQIFETGSPYIVARVAGVNREYPV